MSFNLLPLQLRINSIRIHPSIPCIHSQGVLHFGSKIILAYDFTCLWESSRGGERVHREENKESVVASNLMSLVFTAEEFRNALFTDQQ